MDDLDVTLLVYWEDEESSEDEEKDRLDESGMFKNRITGCAFQILTRRHLHCNDLGNISA